MYYMYCKVFHSFEKHWQARYDIERSLAIKCPTLTYVLAGTKRVQQVLARPGVMEKWLTDEECSKIRKTFIGLHSFSEVLTLYFTKQFWTPTLEFSTHTTLSDFKPLLSQQINHFLCYNCSEKQKQCQQELKTDIFRICSWDCRSTEFRQFFLNPHSVTKLSVDM